MAKRTAETHWKPTNNRKKKKTSVGSSPNSRPLNKHKRKSFKKYRGQGR